MRLFASGAQSMRIVSSINTNQARELLRGIAPTQGRFEYPEMKLEQSGQMFCHVDPVVTAGVEVELVGNVARAKHFVQSYGAGIETKIVFGAAIKVDPQSGETGGARGELGGVLFSKDGGERGVADVPGRSRAGEIGV